MSVCTAVADSTFPSSNSLGLRRIPCRASECSFSLDNSPIPGLREQSQQPWLLLEAEAPLINRKLILRLLSQENGCSSQHMDDLFDILIESGGKETKPAFPIVFGFEHCREYVALQGQPLMAQIFGPVSLLVPLVLAIVTKGDVSQALV